MMDTDVKVSEVKPIPKPCNQLIKNAWSAALVSGLITVALDAYFWIDGVRSVLVYLNLIYVLVSCGLAYGIYRRSRICAVFMLLLFILDKAFAPMVYNSGSIVFFLLFIMCFSAGVVGTFWYHSGAESQEVSTKKLTLCTLACAAIAIGIVAGVKFLSADSPQKAWGDFHRELDKEYAQGSLPVRLDYYTVLQSAEMADKTLIYTYAIENTNLATISDSQLETQSRSIFTRAYCSGNMVQKYGLIVEYVYTQGLSEKTYSYNKKDCVG